MRYYVQETQMSEGAQRTAGIKARDDLDLIFEKESVKAIRISSYDKERENYGAVASLKAHFSIVKEWRKRLAFLKKGDVLFIQFPIIGHSIFQAKVIRELEARGVQVILLIHDLEVLRAALRSDVSAAKRFRLNKEEMDTLRISSRIIVHNDSMREYIHGLGIPEEKLISLQIFDYLIPDFDGDKADKRTLAKDEPMIIAGNLRPHKAQYVYHLADSGRYNLYGIDYSGVQNESIRYFGSFHPDELPYAMNGSFGLVWDGESIDTCSGVYGEYLKINNPHKTSLYLASGIPVVIWEKAALADFIVKNECGIAVSSLYEIKDRIAGLTDEQYAAMKRNAARMGEKLRAGYFTGQAIASCLPDQS